MKKQANFYLQAYMRVRLQHLYMEQWIWRDVAEVMSWEFEGFNSLRRSLHSTIKNVHTVGIYYDYTKTQSIQI